MKLYLLKEPNSMVSGAHKWYLPSAKCPLCSRVISDGALAYPHIEIPSHLHRSKYKVRPSVSWTEYEELAKPLKELLDPDLPLPPGTDFGRLEGAMSGSLTDFAWVWDWECMVSRIALKKLNQALGMSLQVVPSKITSRRKEKPDYCELVALPIVALSEKCRRAYSRKDCPACEWFAETKDTPIEIKRSSLPQTGLHIFRIRELSRRVLCTPEFHQAVSDLGLGNITFQPIEVAEE